jgi:hypothetical protein
MMRAASVQQVPALPDVNAETYPYEVVQFLLNETATFALYAKPVPGHADSTILTPEDPNDFFGINGGYGLNLGCVLHAFESAPARSCDGLSLRQTVGPAVGRFHCVLLFARFPDEGLHWEPGSVPPPAIYDRWRSQRFVLTDPRFTFGAGQGFCGHGIGRTYPVRDAAEPQLLAGAVGNLVEGFGAFRGREASFALCGVLTPDLGFEGVVTCRVVDPHGDLRTDSEPPEIESAGTVRPGHSYCVLRGEKKDRNVRTTFGPKPAPGLDSLITPAVMRSVQYGCSVGEDAPLASVAIGPVVSRMTADVHFNLGAPPGTAGTPGAFTTREGYEVFDPARGRRLGTIKAGVVDGISFGLRFASAPGQPAIRFTGVGPITEGTGAFTGARGLLTVNSVIGIAPHALSLTHVLHLVGTGR